MPSVAVIIPALNEESTIGQVVENFRHEIPYADIFVFDNGSSDGTAQIARDAGAIVKKVKQRGKGRVVCSAFADIESDVYLLVDGDNTYDCKTAKQMIELITESSADVVVAERIPNFEKDKLGHRLGNRMFTTLSRVLFQTDSRDVLSGYRAMSKRFVKSFPKVVNGFEIEIHLTAHAAILAANCESISSTYYSRIEENNSHSKLRTVRDGLRILFAVFICYRQFAPLRFFGLGALCAFLLSALTYFAAPEQLSYEVSYLLGFTGISLFSFGVILTPLTRFQRQQLRLAYLQIPATSSAGRKS
jgi:glycosyltransferase involved in cell wall biosynthesis